MDAVIFLDSVVNRENTLVYAKPLQIYKGIDNKIKLLIKNQDQKLQNLTDGYIIFNLMDSATRELILSRRAMITTDKRGTAYVNLANMDLMDLTAGIYNYSLQYTTGENEQRVIYSDDQYNAQGQARIVDGVYPNFVPSLEPRLGPFNNNNPNTGGFYADPSTVISDVMEVKARSIAQTVQYNCSGFTGTVWIEASMSPTLTSYPTDWFTVTDRQFIDYTGSIFDNFNGRFSLIRFKIHTESGTLDKILYRP